MKILLTRLLLITGFLFIVSACDWQDNPFSDDRIVWDEDNPYLHGQTFQLTVPGEYIILNEQNSHEFTDIRMKIGRILFPKDLDIRETQPSYPADKYHITKIPDGMFFTVEKSFWILKNNWKHAWGPDMRIVLLKDKDGIESTMPFFDFRSTTKPELQAFE